MTHFLADLSLETFVENFELRPGFKTTSSNLQIINFVVNNLGGVI